MLNSKVKIIAGDRDTVMFDNLGTITDWNPESNCIGIQLKSGLYFTTNLRAITSGDIVLISEQDFGGEPIKASTGRRLGNNPILAVDSYKLSHAPAYPDYVRGMYSYGEARTGGRDIMIPVGAELQVQTFFSQQITTEHVNEYVEFAMLHGEPYDREPWDYLVSEYDGWWPVSIWSVREGTPIPSGQVLYAIECTDPKLRFISSYLETSFQRAVWYPTTVATNCYKARLVLKQYYEKTGADPGMLNFALHDFGARGVSSQESAILGGIGHLVSGFQGSDNVEAVRAANFYFKSQMAAFSVPATEHSIECSFGLESEEEDEYIRHVLTTFAKPGKLVSIVIDGRDTYRCAEKLCTKFRDLIIASGAKVVFRPDSGDMLEVVPRILELQAAAFGYDLTLGGDGKAYRKIKYVGLLQGDGVNLKSMTQLLKVLAEQGFRADNVVFGSGGALLQKVDRDTYKFAQKASAILVEERHEDGDLGSRIDTVWKGIAKDPITDPGKASKRGRVMLFKSRVNGEYRSIDIDQPIDVEWEPQMVLLYRNGIKYFTSTLDEMRARCSV